MTPLDAVAVPCCGSGAARVKLSGSSSGSEHQLEIGTCVERPVRTSGGKPEFEMQLGVSLWFGSSVYGCVLAALSPPALTP